MFYFRAVFLGAHNTLPHPPTQPTKKPNPPKKNHRGHPPTLPTLRPNRETRLRQRREQVPF